MPLNILDRLMKSHKGKALEQQREDLLENAKNLEIDYANNRATTEEYETKSKKQHDELIALDLQIVIKKIIWRINKIIMGEKGVLKLDSVRQEKFDLLMQQKDLAEKDVKDSLNVYSKGKLDMESFKIILKEKHSDLLEIEEGIKKLFREQIEAKLKQAEIILSTAKELENAKSDEMVEDLMIQIPDGEEMKFELSKPEKQEGEPPIRERHHRHERRHVH